MSIQLHAVNQQPRDPLLATAPRGLRFTLEHMHDIVQQRRPGSEYLGISYAGAKHCLTLALPRDGIGVVDDPVW